MMQDVGINKIYFSYGKSSIQKDDVSIHQQIGPKFKEETNELLHCFVLYWKLDTLESVS